MKYIFAPMVSMNSCEIDYLMKILNVLKDRISDDYYFIVARTNNQNEISQFYNTLRDDKKNILILLSDEAGIIPPFLDKIHMTFRTYNHKILYDERKIFPIPCGYCAQTGLKSLPNPESKYLMAEQIHKNVLDRKYELFYSGQIAPNRLEMTQKILSIKDNFINYVQITNGFGQGLCTKDYFDILNESKIAIVPDGAVVPESFRYFEAFEAGCIVITSFPFDDLNYKHWYYSESPAIRIKNWNDLNADIIRNILENQKELQEKSIYYYNNYLSSNAVANYIIEKINT
jgi:hypothetical protein